jgi:molybdopterin molybdotransferase
MIDLKEALRIVLDAARPLSSERTDLDAVMNRVLAEDVASDVDLPPFDASTVDGYACRRADLAGDLTVVETIPAGARPTKTVAPHQCAKIMTGATVPPGADYVAMIEQVDSVGADVIRVKGEQPFNNIRSKGSETSAGQVVLKRGRRIKAQHIGMLASVGCLRPLVTRKPKVALIATGDELVDPADKPGPSQIRNSNSPQLTAQLAAMGIAVNDYGMARDVQSEVSRKLAAALLENDVVLISGGVSVGDFDFVPSVLRQHDVELLFDKVAVQPGKPTVFGRSERGYCFGLPGNPVSTFVIFELLVKPCLWKLMGHTYTPLTVSLPVYGGGVIRKRHLDRQSWIPVRIREDRAVETVEYHSSAHTAALCEADGLLALDIGVAQIEQGTAAEVRLICD